MESEYGGGGVMPNGIFPQETADLNASDQLMLFSATGSMTDSHAPVDPYFWFGNVRPAPVAKKIKAKPLTESQRYKESQY